LSGDSTYFKVAQVCQVTHGEVGSVSRSWEENHSRFLSDTMQCIYCS